MEEVLAKYEKLVHFMVRRYDWILQRSEVYDEDDLFQIGVLALFRAYKSFKPDGGSSFVTWACAYIKTAFFRIIERENTYLDAPVSEDESPLIYATE